MCLPVSLQVARQQDKANSVCRSQSINLIILHLTAIVSRCVITEMMRWWAPERMLHRWLQKQFAPCTLVMFWGAPGSRTKFYIATIDQLSSRFVTDSTFVYQFSSSTRDLSDGFTLKSLAGSSLQPRGSHPHSYLHRLLSQQFTTTRCSVVSAISSHRLSQR